MGVQKLNARQQREPALALREPALEPALGSYLPRFALRSQSLSGGVCVHIRLPGHRACTKAGGRRPGTQHLSSRRYSLGLPSPKAQDWPEGPKASVAGRKGGCSLESGRPV